jgi:phage repressor protein C with HTH and peptisase S24 domain
MYGVNPQWLATGDARAQESKSNWIGSQRSNAGAGIGGVAQEMSHPQVSDSPPVPWEVPMNSDSPETFSVRVLDDSMAPLLRSGHLVDFSRSLTARAGDVVLVSDSQGHWFVRTFVQRRPGVWLAVASNPAYQALESERDGLVVLAVFTGMRGRLG